MAGNTPFKRKNADFELSPSKSIFILKSPSPKFPSEASYLFSRPEENTPCGSSSYSSRAFGVTMTGNTTRQLQIALRICSNEFSDLSRSLCGLGRL